MNPTTKETSPRLTGRGVRGMDALDRPGESYSFAPLRERSFFKLFASAFGGSRDFGTSRRRLSDKTTLSVCVPGSRSRQCDSERVAAQNHERWIAANPGQGALPMHFSGRAATSTGPARSSASLHAVLRLGA